MVQIKLLWGIFRILTDVEAMRVAIKTYKKCSELAGTLHAKDSCFN